MNEDPCPQHTGRRIDRRHSVLVLCAKGSSNFEVCERELLQSTTADQALMRDAAHFSKYAQIIYVRLRDLVFGEFMADNGGTQFKREIESLHCDDFRLTSVGCDHAMLSYANFANNLVATPYAILVDDEAQKIVITVRGTLSLDDIVADLQYNPVSLEKTGKVCGFSGEGHFCHKGILTRAKWLYNDINR